MTLYNIISLLRFSNIIIPDELSEFIVLNIVKSISHTKYTVILANNI